MATWTTDILWIIGAVLLVLLNGFFVAAEFALVKVRSSKLAEAARQEKPFTKIAQWMVRRLDKALSACQLGITVASLGLGWVGEPAVAHLVEPVFRAVGVASPVLIHTLAFVVAFTVITAAHLVIGEQAPKIYAIRRPARTVRWCAVLSAWTFCIFMREFSPPGLRDGRANDETQTRGSLWPNMCSPPGFLVHLCPPAPEAMTAALPAAGSASLGSLAPLRPPPGRGTDQEAVGLT